MSDVTVDVFNADFKKKKLERSSTEKMAIRPPGYSLVLTGTAISRVPLRDFWVGGGDAPVSTNLSIGTVRLLRGNGVIRRG